MEADYVVIGAGAMGMSFVDTLLTDTDQTVVLIDRNAQPGGHWTMAYPFVRLHQPSSFYGVASRELGGPDDLASGAEICGYFDQVLRQRFLPTGRVRYFPMSDHLGGGRFTSRVTGETHTVRARRRIVDTTYLDVTVPAMRPPAFDVAPGACCVTPNELARRAEPAPRYTVVGGGKTGIDACLWLLAQGLDPAALTWVVPRDAWLLDRANFSPGAPSAAMVAARGAAIASATSVPELFDRLEACGALLRLSEEVRPSAYRCATVSRAELEQLRRIENVLRLGRVHKIGPGEIILDHDTIPVAPGTVHIDCTADGLKRRPPRPVFDGTTITLQPVLTCQQVASAAVIAHVEALDINDDARNRLCVPVPHPNADTDWIASTRAVLDARLRWQEAGLGEWLAGCRLIPNIPLVPAPLDD